MSGPRVEYRILDKKPSLSRAAAVCVLLESNANLEQGGSKSNTAVVLHWVKGHEVRRERHGAGFCLDFSKTDLTTNVLRQLP